MFKLSRAGAQFLIVHKLRKTQNFEDVLSESAIFKNQHRDQTTPDPPSKTTLKAMSRIFEIPFSKKTPFF